MATQPPNPNGGSRSQPTQQQQDLFSWEWATRLGQNAQFDIYGLWVFGLAIFKDMIAQHPILDYNSLPKRSNHVAVLTGGTRGIGFGVLKKLLQLDYTVIMGVRDIPKTESSIYRLRLEGLTSGRVKLLHLDLESLKTVRTFATQLLDSPEGQRIDLLINNAGTINLPYAQTVDKFERQFQLNYLGHFLLTTLLLPRIKATSKFSSEACKILYTSSMGEMLGSIDDDLEEW